jgi:hypothetical protein
MALTPLLMGATSRKRRSAWDVAMYPVVDRYLSICFGSLVSDLSFLNQFA